MFWFISLLPAKASSNDLKLKMLVLLDSTAAQDAFNKLNGSWFFFGKELAAEKRLTIFRKEYHLIRPPVEANSFIITKNSSSLKILEISSKYCPFQIHFLLWIQKSGRLTRITCCLKKLCIYFVLWTIKPNEVSPWHRNITARLLLTRRKRNLRQSPQLLLNKYSGNCNLN